MKKKNCNSRRCARCGSRNRQKQFRAVIDVPDKGQKIVYICATNKECCTKRLAEKDRQGLRLPQYSYLIIEQLW